MWSIRSNADFRSASRTHSRLAFLVARALWIISIASWHPRPGRNPYCLGSSRASHSGSSALRTRCCWALSAMTGIPSGRFPPFLGIHTRRTGSACPGPPWRCSSTARPARSWEVKATRPSTPGVRRPVLRWVTRRTLTSVLARLRNMSFCRLRTCLKSAACAALKIRCRSRRTCSSCWDHLMASQSGRSSGPFTTPSTPRSTITAVGSPVAAPNLPIRFQRLVGSDSSKGHPAHVSTLTGPDTPVWYTASYTSTTVVGGSGHLSSLSCCLSAAAVRFLAVLSRPGSPPPSRSAYRRLVDSTGPGRGFHVPHW